MTINHFYHYSRFPLADLLCADDALTQSACSAPSLLDGRGLSTHSESPFTPPTPKGLSLGRGYGVPAPNLHKKWSSSARTASGQREKNEAYGRAFPSGDR